MNPVIKKVIGAGFDLADSVKSTFAGNIESSKKGIQTAGHVIGALGSQSLSSASDSTAHLRQAVAARAEQLRDSVREKLPTQQNRSINKSSQPCNQGPIPDKPLQV